MDGARFDTLTRTLTARRSRRRTVVSAFSGALSIVFVSSPIDGAGAKKKCPPCKTRKKGKCKGKKPDGTGCGNGRICQRGSCVAVGPTCFDTIRNGDETDIDCGGGSCPRCVNGQSCLTRNDCASAYCKDTVCQECLTSDQCPNDAYGACACPGLAEKTPFQHACVSLRPGSGVVKPNCAQCPPGNTCAQSAGGVECYPPCGAP
jgi:hypothetical protein